MLCSDHCLYLMWLLCGRHKNITKCSYGNHLITQQVYTFNSETVLNSNDLIGDNPQFITCYCCHRNIATCFHGNHLIIRLGYSALFNSEY